MNDLTAQMQQDIGDYLLAFGKPLLRRRAVNSFSAGGYARQNWSDSLSFTGDMQPIPGKQAQMVTTELGIKYRSERQIFAVANLDVRPADRVISGTESWITNQIQPFDGYTLVYVYKDLTG